MDPPFPYYGSKRRLAPEIWKRLGDPVVYVEPFAGSLGCLLARPGGAGPREIVCDLDGGIANFWRALIADPEAVAYWADYPTIHHDLTARHRWLREWFRKHSRTLSEDPDFSDPKVAGWWVWGISLWIGGSWCRVDQDRQPHSGPTGGGKGVSGQNKSHQDKIPAFNHKPGGRGVAAQREGRPHVANTVGGRGVAVQGVGLRDKHPVVQPHPAGVGVSTQRLATGDKRPLERLHPGGQGVSAQRITVPDQIPHVASEPGGQGVSLARRARPELVTWFRAIQSRLNAVVVLNRSWESALSPTLLMHTPTSPKPSVGVLMDPPYLMGERHSELYVSDAAGDSNSVAAAAYAWAVQHGELYRVAYCCHEGDFPVPAGWSHTTRSFVGIRDDARKHRRDLVMFSPACVQDPQLALWERTPAARWSSSWT